MDEAVKRGILSKEKAAEILSINGVITADKDETASKKALAVATWGQVKAQLAFIAVATAIFGVVKVFDALTFQS